MWSNVELMINDRLVEHSNNIHGYVSMISHLLHDTKESLKSERQMHLNFKDTPGQMDVADARHPNENNWIPGLSWRFAERHGAVGDNPVPPPYEAIGAGAEVGNNGLHNRWRMTKESKVFEMLGSVRLDLFEQIRCLPNGISLKLRLHPQKAAFAFMWPDNNQRFKLNLLDASFIVRKLKPSPGVLLGHDDALKLKPAQYPIKRKECRAIAIPQGISQTKYDNIIVGQQPETVTIIMVEGDAFAGNREKNPYNFRHFNANFVQLYVDGEPVRSRPFRPDIQNNCYVECYESLISERGINEADRSCIVKHEDWPRGYSMFHFDLSPDADCNNHTSLIKQGNLRLEIQFATALAQPIQLLVYAEFSNILKIDQDRQVLIDYV